LDGFGLATLAPAGSDDALLPTVRLHPLVRDASRPPAGSSEQLASLLLAAQLLKRAAPGTGSPEDVTTWAARELLSPHASQVLSDLMACADNPDEG
jgi:hypothetical protein